jgi:hypothetical protein
MDTSSNDALPFRIARIDPRPGDCRVRCSTGTERPSTEARCPRHGETPGTTPPKLNPEHQKEFASCHRL